MTDPTDHSDPLLGQAGWLRKLAQRLVLDPGLAEDAVQETLAAALSAPPRGVASPPVLRAWLSKVLRGKILSARRAEGRRANRERVASRPETLHDGATDAIVGRAESAQILVQELNALAEPHRSVLLLFYMEGLSAADIARELNMRPSAVRTRLSRAREDLRGRLDRRHGGDRGAWLAAMAPLAGLSGAALPQTVPAAAAFTSLGILVMTKYALLAGLALALTLFIKRSTDAALEPHPPGAVTASPALEEASEPQRTSQDSQRVAGAPGAPEQAEAPAPPYRADGTDGLFRPLVRGRVTDLNDQPIAGARISGTWGPHDADDGPETHAFTGPGGHYELIMPARAWMSPHSHHEGMERTPMGLIRIVLHCEADGYQTSIGWAEYPADEPAVRDKSFRLTPADDLTGLLMTVVGPDGKPVVGASVALFDPATGRVHEDNGKLVWLVTRRGGWALSEWRPLVPTIPIAISKDGHFGQGAVLEPSAEPLAKITIQTTLRVGLSGVLLDAAGRPLADDSFQLLRASGAPDDGDWNPVGMTHSLYYMERPWAGIEESRCQVGTGPDGRFRVGHLAPGSYWAQLSDDSVHGPFALGSEVEIALEEEAAIFVRALDHDGRVLRGAALQAANSMSTRSGGLVDRMGRVRQLLPKGRWRLSAKHGDGGTAWQDIEMPRDAGKSFDLVIDYSQGSMPVTIQATDGSGAPLAAAFRLQRRVDDAALGSEATNLESNAMDLEHSAENGQWETPLRPGRYLVDVIPADPWHLPVRTEVTVVSPGERHPIAAPMGGRLRLRWTGTFATNLAQDVHPELSVRRQGMDGPWIRLTYAGGAYAQGAPGRMDNPEQKLGPAVGLEQLGPLLAAGHWDIKVLAEGLVPVEHTVHLQAGADTKLEVSLEPLF